jgi:Butirosin biosynthesis protein H, N-terminal/Domain of unknown function (DUF4872)
LARVLIDYPHGPGGHCGSTAMRDLLEFHGHHVTEEMAFGLGAGMGFFYFLGMEMRPPIYVGGRVAELEENFCANLGIKMEVVAGTEDAKAWEDVKGLIDAGVPTMVLADVYYLDYLNAKKHFSAHRIVLVGYDEERGVVFVADNDRDDIQECSIANLEKARASSYPPQPADHTYFKFELPDELAPLESAIPRALRWTVMRNLRLPPEQTVIDFPGGRAGEGVTGLRMLAEEMPGWPERIEAEQLSEACRGIYVTAEKGGTGYGGNFRRIYGRFLVEADGILPGVGMEAVGREFISIGDLWSEMSFIFKDFSSEPSEAVSRAAPIVCEISRREVGAYEELERITGKLEAP